VAGEHGVLLIIVCEADGLQCSTWPTRCWATKVGVACAHFRASQTERCYYIVAWCWL
jgi:hypothetical protein